MFLVGLVHGQILEDPIYAREVVPAPQCVAASEGWLLYAFLMALLLCLLQHAKASRGIEIDVHPSR